MVDRRTRAACASGEMISLRFRRRPESPYSTLGLSFQRKLEPPKLMKFHLKLSQDTSDLELSVCAQYHCLMIERFQLSLDPIISDDKYGDGEKEIPTSAGIEMRNPFQMMRQ